MESRAHKERRLATLGGALTPIAVQQCRYLVANVLSSAGLSSQASESGGGSDQNLYIAFHAGSSMLSPGVFLHRRAPVVSVGVLCDESSARTGGGGEI
jgi:hypothetical protein